MMMIISLPAEKTVIIIKIETAFTYLTNTEITFNFIYFDRNILS